MVKNLFVLILAAISIVLASCREQFVDEIDLTPINKDLLKGGWHFDSVRAVINTKNGSMQNTAANVCQNFMKKEGSKAQSGEEFSRGRRLSNGDMLI